MAQETEALRVMYTDAESRINELDEILNAASDQKGAGRRAVINQLISANQDVVDSVSEQAVTQLRSAPDDVKFGVFFGFVRALRKEFEEAATAYAESLVEQRPSVQVDPAEVESANKERSDKISQLTHLHAILELMDPEFAAQHKVPRRRSLSQGPRGKRAISYYTWTKNGEPFEGSLTDLAKTLGYERSADLRTEMKDSGINLTRPPDTIEFVTSGGVSLVGTKASDAPDWNTEEVSDSDSDEEDEDEVEDEEDTEDE